MNIPVFRRVFFPAPNLISTFKSRKALFFSPPFWFRWTESDEASKGCSVMKILHCSPWESAGGGNVCQGSLHWGELGLMQTGEPGASPVVALLAPPQMQQPGWHREHPFQASSWSREASSPSAGHPQFPVSNEHNISTWLTQPKTVVTCCRGAQPRCQL